MNKMKQHQIGDFFCDEKHDEVYVLSLIGNHFMNAICVSGRGIGLRWSDAAPVADKTNITEEELRKLLPLHRFKKVSAEYLAVKLMSI